MAGITNPIAEENRIAASSVVEDRRCGERRMKEVYVAWGKQRWGDRRAIISKPEMDCSTKYPAQFTDSEKAAFGISLNIEKTGEGEIPCFKIERQIMEINKARKNYGLVHSELREQVFLAEVKRILGGE